MSTETRNFSSGSESGPQTDCLSGGPGMSAAEIIRSFHQGESASCVVHGPTVKELCGAVHFTDGHSASTVLDTATTVPGTVLDTATTVPGTVLDTATTMLDTVLDTVNSLTGSEWYFSINSTGRVYPAPHLRTGLVASRKRACLRYLNALFIDFDRHDEWPGCDLEELIVQALRTGACAGLPPPTYTVNSGRGIWLLWQFSTPLRATGQNLHFWQMAARSLARSFASLKPDTASSTEPTRIMRVPGSLNLSAGGWRVRFTRQGGPCDFHQLARALGVMTVPTPVTPKEMAERLKRPEKIKAARARWWRLLTGMERLAALRGRFHQGHRSWAVWTIAKAMTLAGCDEDAVSRRCLELGAQGCSPPLAPAVVLRKMRSGMARTGRYDMSNSRVVERFAVTVAELEQIPELKRKARPVSKKAQVRAELESLVAELGRTPAALELRERLGAKRLNVSRTTLWRLTRAHGASGSAAPRLPEALTLETTCFNSVAEREPH